MNAKRRLWCAIVFTLLFAAGVGGLNQAQRRHDAHAQLARINAQRVDADAALRLATARLRSAEDELQAARMPDAQAVTAAAVPATDSTDRRRVSGSRVAMAAEIARRAEASRDDPAVQKADEDTGRVHIGWQYAAFIRRLGLTAEQAERLTDEALNRSMQHWDLLMAARSLGVSDYDPVLAKLDAESEARYLTAQRELLGEAGVRELEVYESDRYPHQIATGFAGMATLAHMPITAAQVQELTQLISRDAGPRPAGIFPARIDIDWDQVDAQARTILTDAQATLFKTTEAPGIARGGARFVVRINRAIMQANRVDSTPAVSQSAATK